MEPLHQFSNNLDFDFATVMKAGCASAFNFFNVFIFLSGCGFAAFSARRHCKQLTLSNAH
jgi:hypothetical protein